ncbi:hypothetical protein UA08_05943 [Talaromyces atroroseus]|uniref:Indoleamine 2,3-dioxygenase n=1 Tax=Talaromyces atroroseus TaxID=1441469 RepID=A0A225AV66_TALAT|nr:hypothetical protein UA08_05943 [Talaromyces atroroseus]OKL58866.1 hypothetical protein UA08_05943 [Talaromyces atroroseus]
MLDVPEAVVNLDDFRISYETGFLPCTTTTTMNKESRPLHKLSNPYYAPWEDIMPDLPELIRSGEIRRRVLDLPVLSVEGLNSQSQNDHENHDEAEWQRAYVILGFLTHAYIWGGEKAENRLPVSISLPFLQVAARLELPPCATYAALNLWNFTTITNKNTTNNEEEEEEDIDLTNPDNITTINSFTGTDDERWFLVVSVAIEACGAKVIRLVLDTINAIHIAVGESHNITIEAKNTLITNFLSQMADCIDELGRILDRMYERNDPMVFYHQLRPLLAGSKNMATAGLPNGVFYDLGDGQGEWHQYSGGSNAQSSLIQLFDIALGIQHTASGEVEGKKSNDKQTAFMKEMRNYMPGPHRRFLEHVASITNIRPYALSLPASSAVRQAYNAVVMKLGGFRDKHIQIVSRYVIAPASRPPPQRQNGLSTGSCTQRVNLASATSRMKAEAGGSLSFEEKETKREENKVFYGTGGTDLIPFLKATRDGTKAAARFVD